MKTPYKHSKEEILSYSGDDLRWATHEEVASYRATRLKCSTIADLGCGIGLQAIAFAQMCKRVIAVDKDEQKLEHARKNATLLGATNITFLHGDVLDTKIIEQLTKAAPDIIFLDPERLESETERSIDSIQPNIKDFLSTYSKITIDIAIEFPPQIKSISLKCEQEYLSLNGKLNRLTLYFGKLKKSPRSAVILPQMHRLEGECEEVAEARVIEKYLFEPDGAVVKAGLTVELAKQTQTECIKAEKHELLTGPKNIKSAFFTNCFRVVRICSFASLNQELGKLGFGKVTIRYSIEPENFWQEKGVLERGLIGKRRVHLFKLDERLLICEKVSGR